MTPTNNHYSLSLFLVFSIFHLSFVESQGKAQQCEFFNNGKFLFRNHEDTLVPCEWIEQGPTLLDITERRNQNCQKSRIADQCQSSCRRCCNYEEDKDACLEWKTCTMLMQRPIDIPENAVRTISLFYLVDIEMLDNSAIAIVTEDDDDEEEEEEEILVKLMSDHANYIYKENLVGCGQLKSNFLESNQEMIQIVYTDFKSLKFLGSNKATGSVDVTYLYNSIQEEDSNSNNNADVVVDMIQKSFDDIRGAMTSNMDGSMVLNFMLSLDKIVIPESDGASTTDGIIQIDRNESTNEKTTGIISSLFYVILICVAVMVIPAAVFFMMYKKKNKTLQRYNDNVFVEVNDDDEAETIVEAPNQSQKIQNMNNPIMGLALTQTNSFPIMMDDSDDWVVATVNPKVNDEESHISSTIKA